MNSLLQTISETEMIEDQLRNQFQQTDTFSTSYEPSHILDNTTSAVKSVFLQMLSSITNPILNFVFTVVFTPTLVWSVNLTIWSLCILLPYAFSKVVPKRRHFLMITLSRNFVQIFLHIFFVVGIYQNNS